MANGDYVDSVRIGSTGEEVPIKDPLAVRRSELLDLVYPVGSIYMSASLSTVAAVQAQFGGTWKAWGSGRVPVGVDSSDAAFNTVEETGGSKNAVVPSHSHTATFSGTAVGNHTHTGPSHTHTGPSHTHAVSGNTSSAGAHTHGTGNTTYTKFMTTNASSMSNESTDYLKNGLFNVPRVSGEAGEKFSTRSASASAGAHTHSVSLTTGAAGTGATGAAGTGATGAAGAHTPAGTVSVASAGSSATNANLQPYITCYMYKRIA